ncbi:chloride channel protein [Sphingobacterium psychroaquaticum]|uniref:H+/Cl-antiporter ClcA n=1 Tax=Sphingobacterium psychroaquaticum TaxID=561061 RepID=A0A1X7IPD3_9SPHI|nr:chloride channel protein [Sphingobacterium psychroaquaticum]SMG16754.1 H+/Cl-antiporter ClcA [Sphingobacterium psychroaquaticum]
MSLSALSRNLIFRWLLSIVLIAFLVGSTSALFLYLLNAVTNYRQQHLVLIYLLPLAGVFIVWLYQRYGSASQGGNKLVLAEFKAPSAVLPFLMAPLIFVTTLITHLFGGSAGREGTAIQYGATIADQFSRFLPGSAEDRRTLLSCGIAAGFASLFGTPWAGLFFAIELVGWRYFNYKRLLATMATAFLAFYVCNIYGNQHTHYPQLTDLPTMWSWLHFGSLLLAAAFFGCTAYIFIQFNSYLHQAFSFIKQPLFRPILGGSIVVAWVLLSHTTRHIGLGIPTLVSAFDSELPAYDFAVKLILTTITLSCGFKGGEVTPLFFIGATLGNALALFIPLPMALLVAMGFVAVFAGSTKTPLACAIMGAELFGVDVLPWVLVACVVAYVLSGKKSIYS